MFKMEAIATMELIKTSWNCKVTIFVVSSCRCCIYCLLCSTALFFNL